MTSDPARVVFVRRVTAPDLVIVGVIAAVVGAIKKRRPWPRAVGRAVAALGLSSLSATVRVVADASGLQVGFGPWGWPARKITIDRIVGARVEHVNPVWYGGWGYRIRPFASRYILRKGPAIVVDLTNGRSFGVSLNDPEEAVTVLNAALAARSEGGEEA